MPDERVPLSLRMKPDMYLCTWLLPDAEGHPVEIPGSITLAPDEPPRGRVYGNLPVTWDVDDGIQLAAGFPQEIECPILNASLANGGSVMVMPATVFYDSPASGEVIGGAALARRGFNWMHGPGGSTHHLETIPKVISIKCQVGALDAAMGVAPLTPGPIPMRRGETTGSTKWSATYNDQSSLEWENDGHRLKVEYIGLLRVHDWYEQRLAWSPIATFTPHSPISLAEAIALFVDPLRAILSVATGKSQPLTYLSVQVEDEEPDFEVYGIGCTQSPYQSSSSQLRDQKCAFGAHADGVSLLDFALRWADLQSANHPLTETYGAMLHTEDRHPRSRYLLLLQALEGMHGHNTKQEFNRRVAAHQEQRNDALDEVQRMCDERTYRFIKKSLPKTPITGLDFTLREMMKSVPGDTISRLADTALLREVMGDPSFRGATESALRVVRNHLAHGTRGYEPGALNEAVILIERVVRAHALRVIGASDEVVARAIG